MPPNAMLVLEDGTVFRGQSFGAEVERTGEVAFHTAMVGYPQLLSDPTGFGQILCMTYPLIGNAGIAEEEFESRGVHPAGLVVREHSRIPSNLSSRESLGDRLRRAGVAAIDGVDTRRLTCHLRRTGTQRAILSPLDDNPLRLGEKARTSPARDGVDLVRGVTTPTPYPWDAPLPDGLRHAPSFHVVAYDFGVKRSFLRSLVSHGCRVTVVPATTPPPEVLALQPDGVFLSNGPGDPRALAPLVETVRALLGTVPLFGIGLGHQLLGLALGGSVRRLKNGHCGCNHPVKHLAGDHVEMTTQMHQYVLEEENLESAGVVITHRSLNDNTVEGMAHRACPAFSVQYHPVAAPGPRESCYLYARFLEMMRSGTAVAM